MQGSDHPPKISGDQNLEEIYWKIADFTKEIHTPAEAMMKSASYTAKC